MNAILFPGQGSQFIGMGDRLFSEYPEIVELYSSIFNYSIVDLCLRDGKNQLTNTEYTQPAIYTVNHLSLLNYLKDGRLPDFVAGHSLGEYNALVASGVLDFETGLRLVKKRGHLMSNAAEGGMAAVLNLSIEQIKQILEEENYNNDIEIANLNSPSQIIISGDKQAIINAEKAFTKAGARYLVLKVGGAFHSKLMQSAGDSFKEYLNQFKFNPPTIPIISNVTARPYGNLGMNELLSKQITSSVNWTETIQYLMFKGVDQFQELGPGNVLSGLVTKIQQETDRPNLIFHEQTESKNSEPLNLTESIKRDDSFFANSQNAQKNSVITLKPDHLGNPEFMKRYGVKYPYLSGAMYRGIASTDMVISMGENGFMGFLGTGGMSRENINESIIALTNVLGNNIPFGMNLLHKPNKPEYELDLVKLYIERDIRYIEASAFMGATEALVLFRLHGAKLLPSGKIHTKKHILAKISRPEIAKEFLSPAPREIVEKLLAKELITAEEAEIAQRIPLAGELCVEADSGGHTDSGNLNILLPTIKQMAQRSELTFNYQESILVGGAGGIGTPSTAAAAFMLGADFILTGSINQCTVEAGMSDGVKDILESIGIQDTEYAPAGDMFEMGAKVQVLKKGLLFPYRANKLFNLYKEHNSIEEIDQLTIDQLEKRFFKKSIQDVWGEVQEYFGKNKRGELDLAERSSKYKMALIFKWYFNYSTEIAMKGELSDRANFQVHCGPALGAFNEWVKDSELASWRNRYVHKIALKILDGTCEFLEKQINDLFIYSKSKEEIIAETYENESV